MFVRVSPQKMVLKCFCEQVMHLLVEHHLLTGHQWHHHLLAMGPHSISATMVLLSHNTQQAMVHLRYLHCSYFTSTPHFSLSWLASWLREDVIFRNCSICAIKVGPYLSAGPLQFLSCFFIWRHPL